MVVNGRAWPYLNVEQRRYRFRFLNGCNSRFLILAGDKGVTFWQIGAEGGFLPAPVKLKQLLMAPAERADVIIDFSTYPVGSKITLLNQGPDMPFGGNVTGQAKADPATTGQVMQFRVVKRVGADASTPPGQLGLPRLAPLGAAAAVRKVSLNEMMSMAFNGPAAAMLGTVGANGAGVLKMWDDPVTEQPAQGKVETWEIHNFTIDAHPIHLHQVQFQVVNRQAMGSMKARAPEAWEKGFKDTVIAYPGEITRINARFDLPGRFVWHCHIVEHEDNEMMRPLDVV
jgi:FtsP/CotA-like multicopper oxidase with cupredoxin domain